MGTPHDNAVMESFLAVFKKEEFYRSDYRSEAELRKRIDEYTRPAISHVYRVIIKRLR